MVFIYSIKYIKLEIPKISLFKGTNVHLPMLHWYIGTLPEAVMPVGIKYCYSGNSTW